MTGVRRRAVLGTIGAAALAIPLAGCDETRLPKLLKSTTKPPAPFQRPLQIPRILRPTSADTYGDHYEMTVSPADVEILPGLRTRIWGYDGTFPGPTLELRRGRPAFLRQRNALPESFVTHLHGGRTPTSSDGYPTDLVAPGTARTYAYPLDQRAATLWYHDHRMDHTGRNVWLGLAGMAIVRDDEEAALPLPAGDREVPLIICDRSFGADGGLHYPTAGNGMSGMGGAVRPAYGGGLLGDVILVNGVPWPYLEVAAARYRFRLLNASNARAYELTLDPPPPGGKGFAQIGGDGGLLAAPVAHDTVRMAPAERFDVVVDFSRYRVGDTVTVRNRLAGGRPGQVMRFHITKAASDDSAIPRRLGTVERLDRRQATVTRAFRFRAGGVHGMNGWTINGRAFDLHRIDADPRLGNTEIWKLTSTERHPVHIHLAPFQVLSRNGRGPGRHNAGWKDTVELSPGETVEIIARFDGYRGKYVLHCHNLEHEDMAMMANFEVI
jgi:spore coat protein A